MRHVAVFARRPVVGTVKTRLTPALPAPLACRLHVGLLADALDVARAVRAERRILWWDAPAGADVAEPVGFEVRVQPEGDLGARLAAAFAEVLKDPNDRAVVIGTDCPGLAPSHLDRALDALDSHDLVLAPARDGGYGLIGLRRPVPALFVGIDWGTERVRDQTLERARSAGLRVEEVERADDIDTPADLIRWLAAAAASSSSGAPHTRAVLAAIGLLPLPRP